MKTAYSGPENKYILKQDKRLDSWILDREIKTFCLHSH